jgi:hypothetical protein
MDNGIFTLTEKGLFRMELNHQWQFQEASARGLRDPWSHKPNKPLHTEEIISLLEGKEMKCTKTTYPTVDDEVMDAWKAERDEYMRQRDEWIAMEIFHEYGYDDFLAEAANLSAEFRNSVRPCDSRNEPQCNMFCPHWDVCERR